MSALTDVTTKEHIHALAALTRGISLLLYDNKQKRKFVKNPSAVNIGGISDEKYSEAFGNDIESNDREEVNKRITRSMNDAKREEMRNV